MPISIYFVLLLPTQPFLGIKKIKMKIALIGYGKMGHEIERIALERGHEIVCTIDIGEEDKFDSHSLKEQMQQLSSPHPKVQWKTIEGLLLQTSRLFPALPDGWINWMKSRRSATATAKPSSTHQTSVWESIFSSPSTTTWQR